MASALTVLLVIPALIGVVFLVSFVSASVFVVTERTIVTWLNGRQEREAAAVAARDA